MFDEILLDIMGMLKEQVVAFNKKFGKTSETRLQVSPVVSMTHPLDRADIIAAYHAGWRIQPE